MQKESQRIVVGSFSDCLMDKTTGLYATSSSGNDNTTYNIMYASNSGTGSSFKKGQLKDITCHFYGKKGHKDDKCWKKHGVPDHVKKKWSANQVDFVTKATLTQQNMSFGSTISKTCSPFTTDEMKYMMQFLVNYRKDIETDVLVNMTCIFSCDLAESSSNISWIIDSDASHHMTCNRVWLMILKVNVIGKIVNLPNGHTSPVSHIGSCVLDPNITLTKILYAPDFKFNLMSTSRICRDLDVYIMLYFMMGCIFTQRMINMFLS